MSARFALLLAMLAAPAFLPASARAQDIDLSKGGAIDVTSQDGMEWRQNEQMVIANGNARAVRGTVTVTADRLIARYRKKAGAAGAQTVSTGKPPSNIPGTGSDTGQNEIYRLEAEGNVKIFTATDLAVGDKAVYDIDQAVLLLTGKAMSVTTPQQVVTARDTIEYWSQKHMAVARGDATVTTSDNRRVTADTLVAYTKAGPTPEAAAPARPAGKAGADPIASSGKLERVEGFGNVEIRTPTEVFKGDRGVYVADTEMARLAGHVRVVRGQNFLDGDEALVNMKTGIYTLTRDKPGARVQGLVIPNEAQGAVNGAAPGAGSKGGASSTPSPKR